MNLMDGQGRLNFNFHLFLLYFAIFSLLDSFFCHCRFEWPNGDKYTGQYINGKRNGLGDMQVILVILIGDIDAGDIGDGIVIRDIVMKILRDIFSMGMAMSTRERGEMDSTTARSVLEYHNFLSKIWEA